MTNAPVFVGIDISKARLDVALRPTGAPFTVPHDETGIALLVQRLGVLSPAGIVLEATGGLEVLLSGALATAGLPVAVVNPRQSGISPAPPGDWPRPIHSMPNSWPSLLTGCDRRAAPYRTRVHSNWPR